MTTPPDLSVIKAAAGAATPGPWQNGIDDLEGVVAPNEPGLGNVICIPPRKNMYSSLEHWDANAHYIALMSPSTTEALIARVEAAERGWRDIESAPYDGTVILIASVGGPPYAAYWSRCPQASGWDDAKYPWAILDGANGLNGVEHGTRHAPTHWRPLPEPPAREALPPTGRQ